MISKLNYYISDCVDPYQNLATEKFLLDHVEENTCILYLWQNQKTVVIGRNQNPWVECQCSLLEADDGKLARRLSGGGAVFHDLGNLNFTFLYCTPDHNLTKQLRVIQKACSFAGIKTELSGRNDILADGRKFSGNAFFNSKGKSYHHGTILVSSNMKEMSKYLTPSKAKLESKGVKSVESRTINLSELSHELTCEKMAEHMLSAFEEVYGLPITQIIDIDSSKISQFADEFSSWEYIYGKSFPFSISFKNSFNWGEIDLQLQITNGVISSVKLYTDSMDWQLSTLVENALLNSRFELKSMQQALTCALPNSFADDINRFLEKQQI